MLDRPIGLLEYCPSIDQEVDILTGPRVTAQRRTLGKFKEVAQRADGFA